MESLYKLEDLLCDQVDQIVAKNDITPVELERAYKVVDIIKDIETIGAMKDYDEDYNSYDDGMSYARNRDSMGRYSSRRGRSYDSGNYSSRRSYNNRMMPMDRGYSGDDSKEQMMQKIEEMKHKIEQM